MKTTPENNYINLLEKFPPKREYLIQMLHAMQDASPQNYISEEAMLAISNYTKLSMAAIKGLVGYYSMFSSAPKGRFVIRVCKSPVCVNHESDAIITELCKHYKLEGIGGVSYDGLVSVESSECMGRCAEGTAVSVNTHYIENASAENIVTKIESFIKNKF